LDENTDAGYTLSARRIHFLAPTPEAPARDERDIVLVRSLDQGTSWSAKTVVNWDSPPRYSESLPCLTVDDTGALAAFWYDRRQTDAPDATVGGGILTDVYMNQSLDGVSFSPARRVTDESSLFLGVPTTAFNVGDFQSAFANGRDIYLGWTDGRSSNTSTSGIDAYADRVVRPRSAPRQSVVQFPNATEGDSVKAVIDLRNKGATPLQVTGISLPFGAMTVTPRPPFQIPVNDSIPLSFDVKAITPADSSGVVRIQSSDPFDSLLSLPVVARARPLGFQIVSEEFFREPVVLQSQDIPVIVVMDDSVHVDSLWVYYRTGGAPTFSPLALTPVSLAEQPARYRAFIPTEAVGPRGLEFFVAARNGGATSYRPSPSQPVRFRVRVGDLTLPTQAPDAYRMISVPLDCDGATVMDLFRDDLGRADPTVWRLFGLARSSPELTQYQELADDDTTLIRPGSAYWLITHEGLHLDTSPAVGMSTPTSADYAMPLNGTWNMIGSPFDFPVAWADLRVDGTPTTDQSLVEAPMLWNPVTKAYQPTDVLMPFEGYFVKRNGSSPVSLAIPPVAQSIALVTSAGQDGLPNDAWELTLRISGGNGSDAVSVGVSPLGRTDHDRLDGSHPPPAPGDGVWVAIPHAEWGDYRGSYWRDVREPLIELPSASAAIGHRWPLSVGVHSDGPQPWTEMALAVGGLERIPSGFQVMLVDDHLGRTIDLRANHEYRFVEKASTGVPEPRFHLLIGTAAFIEQGGVSSQGATNRLSDAAPNPFQTNTMIRYEVGAREPVDLAIFDVQGRRVKTLAKGSQPPGIYDVVWSGASERGASVGAGLYFVRLEAGGHSFIRKLLKVGTTAR
jgi:hypothetical protein